MSENNVNGITGASVTTTGIVGATIAIGQYIVNDYVITIAEAEGDYGYTMTITRGTDTQTVTLYGLTPAQYDAMLGYLEQAQAAAQSAQSAAESAGESETAAREFERVAGISASSASSAKNAAQSAASNARSAASDAASAKNDAVTAKNAAEAAATRAETAAGQITGMTAEAETLEPGSSATASFLDGVLSLGIPAGAPGADGDDGNGIVSIVKTGTSGNVDTYTITYTNGTTSAFTVTNGVDGAVTSVAGKTGAVALDAGDVSFDDQQTYNDGTVGAGLTNLKSQVNALPFTEQYDNVTITWTRTDQYYSKVNGNLVSGSYYYQCSIPVDAGDVFILTGTNDYNKAIYVTLDDNDAVVRHPATGNSGTVSDIEIIIESGESTLVLQSNANDRSIYILKKAAGVVLNDAVVGKTNLTPEVNALLPATEFVNLFNPNDSDVITGKYIDRSGVLHDESIFCVSGFIPIERNVDYQFPVYANYFGTSTVVYVPYYNTAKTYASFATGTYDLDTQLLTVKFTSTSASFCRINFAAINTYLVNTLNHNPEVMMITKAPYPSKFVPYGEQAYFANDVYLDEQNAQGGNPLFRKTAIFLGDSICNGGSANDGKNGWAGRIGRKNQMLWKNFGISGATFTSGLTGSSGVISDQPIADPAYSGTPDYIIIEGGTNDADLIGSALDTLPEKFGSYTLGDYTSDFDNTTYCGAIEKLFKNACNNVKQAKIGVIIAPKMGQLNATITDYTAEHNNRRFYFETLIKLCEKWGIPYINLWDGSILNPMLSSQYTYGQASSDGKYYTDGQHLTSEGYDYVSPIIEAWMRTL